MVFYGLNGRTVAYKGTAAVNPDLDNHILRFGTVSTSYPVSASAYKADGTYLASGVSDSIEGSILKIPPNGVWKINQNRPPFKRPILSYTNLRSMVSGCDSWYSSFTASGKCVENSTFCSAMVDGYEDNVYSATSNMYWTSEWNSSNSGFRWEYDVFFTFENSSTSSLPPGSYYTPAPNHGVTAGMPEKYYSSRKYLPYIPNWQSISLSADAYNLECISTYAVYNFVANIGPLYEGFTNGGSGEYVCSSEATGYWSGSESGMTGFSAWARQEGSFYYNPTREMRLVVHAQHYSESDGIRVPSSMPIGKWYFSGIAM